LRASGQPRASFAEVLTHSEMASVNQLIVALEEQQRTRLAADAP
jgi:hypothetical protein